MQTKTRIQLVRLLDESPKETNDCRWQRQRTCKHWKVCLPVISSLGFRLKWTQSIRNKDKTFERSQFVTRKKLVTMFAMLVFSFMLWETYLEMDDGNFIRMSWWTFQQQLALKYEHDVEFLLQSPKNVFVLCLSGCDGYRTLILLNSPDKLTFSLNPVWSDNVILELNWSHSFHFNTNSWNKLWTLNLSWDAITWTSRI